MLTQKRNLSWICLIGALMLALAGGVSNAQQTPPADIWQLIPSNSLVVMAFDGRQENASIQVLVKNQDEQAKDQLDKQYVSMQKAIESFATLFGVSLDFAKDIQSWAGDQWAFVLISDGDDNAKPVFIIKSKDAGTANAALQKLLAPWQRLGELAPQPDSDYPITGFKMSNGKFEAYAAAFGSVVAVSTSKDILKQALKGGGFAAGSPGDKTFKALSGSLFLVYADPAILKMASAKFEQAPITAMGLGVSVVDTGVKMRAIGYPNEAGAAFLKQIFATRQAKSLAVNAAIPSMSLGAASLPNLQGFLQMAGAFGVSDNPIMNTIQMLGDTQISAAITAVLPKVAGVASVMTDSDQAAADKLAKVIENLKQAKIPSEQITLASGTQATKINVSSKYAIYLTQVGKYILVGTDSLALTNAAEVINGVQPGLTQSQTYDETIAGLGDSNLATLYVNLAPIQGVGYLIEGLGLGQMGPFYSGIAKGLENLQALGVGLGFDGEVASATIFLRAKPGIGPSIGPAVVAGTAIGAAVLFPVFTRAREAARMSTCTNNLKELANAVHIFAADCGGKLPSRDNWKEQLKPYMQFDIGSCPSKKSIYAFNKNLSGINMDKIKNPSEIVLFFEANRDLPGAFGSRNDAILPHNGQGMFAYVDGHIEKLSSIPSQSHWVVSTVKPPVKKAPVKKSTTAGKRRGK